MARTTRPPNDPDRLDAECMRREIHSRLFGDDPEAIRIDRFVVSRRLGAGGMGVVFRAYDPKLDRRVAIKLVRSRPGDGTGPHHQQRLLREARALARLAHPNVISVFEVGTQGDDVFIAMELVEGETLEVFARAPGRSARAILEVYLQAGAGLQAAHEAGLVHRDFKPQNVLVGRDGRVRVLDFGLARVRGASRDRLAEAGISESLSETSTDAEGVLGTPAYMAPEQRRGCPATVAADQFAFCASLHEALTGSLPRVAPGRGAPVRRGAGLPRGLRRVLARGLAWQPEARWPSMHALLHALRRQLGRRRRRTLGALGLAALLAAMVAVATRDDPCPEDASPQLAGVWDAERKASVEAAVRGGGGEAANEAARLTGEHLDAFAQQWAQARQRACEAHHVQHAESAELFDRKMTCLGRRRDALDALAVALEPAEAARAAKAVEAALALPPIGACEDNERLLADVAPPEDPGTAAAVERLRGTLVEQRALVDLGDLRAALELARTAVAEADALGYRPVQAEAALALGKALGLSGEADAASKALRDAVWYAEAGRHDEIVALALADLVAIESDRDAGERAKKAASRARAAIERWGRAWPAAYAVEVGLGGLARREARYADGHRHASRALELARLHAPGSAREAAATNNLGIAAYNLGDYETARTLLSASLESERRWLGELHPHVINTLTNLAAADERRGDADAAQRGLTEAIATAERAGLDLQLAKALHNLSKLRRNQGRAEEGVAPAERAVELMSARAGPDNADTVALRIELGAVYGSVGRDEEAKREFEGVVRSARASGRDNQLALALHNLADIALTRGDGAGAEQRVREAIRVASTLHGDDHPDPGQMRIVLALALMAQGRAAEAVEVAERSVGILRHADGAHPALGRAELTRAKALAAAGRPDEAKDAAEAALVALAAGIPNARVEGQVRELLAELERDGSAGVGDED